MIPVKICCIQSIEEAALAVSAGARAVGLVSEMPSGWGPIPEERIARIAATIPPMVSSVLLSSKPTAAEIIDQLKRCKTNAVQIVDEFPIEGYAAIRDACPGVEIYQAVHVLDESAIDQAKALASEVDGLILDTGSPHSEVKVLGGTGKTHDWSISRRIVDEVDCPVLLAGGLKPENISEAIETVRPYGIDLCTGVRRDLALHPVILARFIRAVEQTRA
jgi:phosphoribosylanthranilate isomerase